MDSQDAATAAKAPSVGKSWAWLLAFTGGMTLIAFLVWGTLSGAPAWFHALFGFQTLWALAGVASAHKRRSQWDTAQPRA